MTSNPSLQSVFNFLGELEQNNNRPWFEKHKNNYLAAHEKMIDFADELLLKMKSHDLIETPSGKKSLFRIYRDVRFSKNKTPYKTSWSGRFKRATKYLRGGYYYHIEPGNSFVAGGFWGPNAADLLRIRQAIAQDDLEFRKIIKSKPFKSNFGELQGNGVKTAPRGFPKDHPAIDLIRMKQFIIRKPFSDKQVLNKKFATDLSNTFKRMRPFLDHMSEILTTDANGRPLF